MQSHRIGVIRQLGRTIRAFDGYISALLSAKLDALADRVTAKPVECKVCFGTGRSPFTGEICSVCRGRGILNGR